MSDLVELARPNPDHIHPKAHVVRTFRCHPIGGSQCDSRCYRFQLSASHDSQLVLAFGHRVRLESASQMCSVFATAIGMTTNLNACSLVGTQNSCMTASHWRLVTPASPLDVLANFVAWLLCAHSMRLIEPDYSQPYSVVSVAPHPFAPFGCGRLPSLLELMCVWPSANRRSK